MKSLNQYINEEVAGFNYIVIGAFYYNDGSDDVELVGMYPDHDNAQKAMEKWWKDTKIEDGDGVSKKKDCYSAYLEGSEWAKCKIIKI